jgi:hypothetical protein
MRRGAAVAASVASGAAALVALAAPWGNPFSGGGVEICHPTLTGRPPVPLKTKYDPNNFVSHESEHSTDCLELDIDAPQAADPAAAVIERSIESFARVPNGGLIVGPDTTNTVHRNHIVALAGRVSEVCDVGAIHEHFGAWKRRPPVCNEPADVVGMHVRDEDGADGFGRHTERSRKAPGGRLMFGFCVELGADQDHYSRQSNPKHECDEGTQGAVSLVVAAKIFRASKEENACRRLSAPTNPNVEIAPLLRTVVSGARFRRLVNLASLKSYYLQ